MSRSRRKVAGAGSHDRRIHRGFATQCEHVPIEWRPSTPDVTGRGDCSGRRDEPGLANHALRSGGG
jgi:hypothetical protein